MTATRKIQILMLTAFIGFGAGARTLTLQQCMEAATANNPGLQASQINIEKARAMRGTAFDAPNTSVELTQNATEGGGIDNGLKFSQEFDFPTVYVARHRVLKAEHSVAATEYERDLCELRGKVAEAYYTLVYLDSRIAYAAAISNTYRGFAETAAARYEAGETSRLESLNAQRISEKSARELNALLARRDIARGELASLTGIEGPVEPADSSLCRIEIRGLEEFSAPATASLRLIDMELRRDEEALNLERQQFMPGLFLSATSQLLIKGFNPYHIDRERFRQGNFMGFSVGITVPLFFGAKRARLVAARHDIDMTRSRREEERLRLDMEYDRARNALEQALRDLEYYEKAGLPQAAEIRRLAKVSYELGEIDYQEYIQNMEGAFELETGYMESVNNYNIAAIRIQTLKGTL